VWSQFDLFIEYKLAQGLLGSLAERLAFFRRIDKGDTDQNLFFVGAQHFDRVAVGNAYCASADRFLLEAQIVRGRFALILAENGKNTRENE